MELTLKTKRTRYHVSETFLKIIHLLHFVQTLREVYVFQGYMAREGIVCKANIPTFLTTVDMSVIKTIITSSDPLSLAFRIFLLQRNYLCRPRARPHYTPASVASTSNELEMDKNKLITQDCVKKDLCEEKRRSFFFVFNSRRSFFFFNSRRKCRFIDPRSFLIAQKTCAFVSHGNLGTSRHGQAARYTRSVIPALRGGARSGAGGIPGRRHRILALVWNFFKKEFSLGWHRTLYGLQAAAFTAVL